MPAICSPGPARPSRAPLNGFTTIEIVVVMVLISIITAVVLGRSITTAEVDVVGQTAKIRNHLRYAQSMAMKRSDREVWGIYFDTDRYWFFSGSNPAASRIQLPGGEYTGGNDFIAYSDLGVSLSLINLPNRSVYFDQFGRPYTRWVDATDYDLLAVNATVTISASGKSRDVLITPETGLIE
jgi:type II secretory pathway pseudopilin PulG